MMGVSLINGFIVFNFMNLNIKEILRSKMNNKDRK